jgi:hypothetical protein
VKDPEQKTFGSEIRCQAETNIQAATPQTPKQMYALTKGETPANVKAETGKE